MTRYIELQLPLFRQLLFERFDLLEEVSHLLDPRESLIASEKPDLCAFFFFTVSSTSSQVTGVETVGFSFARSE